MDSLRSTWRALVFGRRLRAPPLVHWHGDAYCAPSQRPFCSPKWTCCAGCAGTRIRSEALHRILTIGGPAADRAGARPYHPIGIASSDRQTWCTVSHIMAMSLRSKWAVGKARGGRISQSIRNRRATRPPAHFQRNPPGRGQLAVFLRCSLDPYESRYGRFARALKNGQLTCGDITIICETVH